MIFIEDEDIDDYIKYVDEKVAEGYCEYCLSPPDRIVNGKCIVCEQVISNKEPQPSKKRKKGFSFSIEKDYFWDELPLQEQITIWITAFNWIRREKPLLSAKEVADIIFNAIEWLNFKPHTIDLWKRGVILYLTLKY